MTWSEVRVLVLLRDWYQCRHCLSEVFLTIHHIWPRALGGGDEPYNLVTLCNRSHQDICSWCTRAPEARDPEWARGQVTPRVPLPSLIPYLDEQRKYLQEWVV